jgi:hypothetical protein
MSDQMNMADLNCKAEESKETSRQTVVQGWGEGGGGVPWLH